MSPYTHTVDKPGIPSFSPKMDSSTETFIELAKARRSVYALTNASTVPDSRLEKLVHDAILHVPSSFNTQTTRLVLLLRDENQRFWDVVEDVYESMVANSTFPEDKWKAGTKPKLDKMRAGYGTVSCDINMTFRFSRD